MVEVFIGSTVVAAVVSGVVSLVLHSLAGRREATSRRRELFAEAFGAYTAYREFPFVVRRRRADAPEDERIRISVELRRVQERLSFFLAWTLLEDRAVGEAFATLVEDLRRVAGGEIRRAWMTEPATQDEDMNIADIDLTALGGAEKNFLTVLTERIG